MKALVRVTIHIVFFYIAAGPKAWPLVGNLPEVARERTRGVEDNIWHQYYLQYGPICRIKLGEHAVHVMTASAKSRHSTKLMHSAFEDAV